METTQQTGYVYGDDFYFDDLSDLLEELDLEDEASIDEFLNGAAGITVTTSRSEPIITLSEDWITERIPSRRWPEDADEIHSKVNKILLEHIDFATINAKMPKLMYRTKETEFFTRQQLIEAL